MAELGAEPGPREAALVALILALDEAIQASPADLALLEARVAALERLMPWSRRR